MTREELIQKVGIEYVDALENEACEPTSRLIYDAFEPEHAGMVEFQSCIETEKGLISAYYYQKAEDMEGVDDLGDLNWEVDHYEYEEYL